MGRLGADCPTDPILALCMNALAQAEARAAAGGEAKAHSVAQKVIIYIYKLVNKRSDTDLGNTQSAPRGGERSTVC